MRGSVTKIKESESYRFSVAQNESDCKICREAQILEQFEVK